MKTALVLSAGGMFGAYQAGAWKVLSRIFQPDLVAGASAGAINGWAIAGGCTPDELLASWLDPGAAKLMRPQVRRLAKGGLMDPAPLEEMARVLFHRYSPRIPFGLTVVEVPSFRLRLVRGEEITWRHLVAACAIPLCFPPVRIDGKSYVDGGLLGALPLWAAAEMGASRAVAVDSFPKMPSAGIRVAVRTVRWFAPGKATPQLQMLKIGTGEPLGSLQEAMYWTRENAERWIERGERDAERQMETSFFTA